MASVAVGRLTEKLRLGYCGTRGRECRCVGRNGLYHEPLDTLQSLQWHRPEKAGNEARGILMPMAPQLHFPVTGSGKLGDMVAVEFERVRREIPPQRPFINWNYVLTCSTF